MNVRDVLRASRLADFWNVLREVDPQQIIREAEQPVRVIICGSPDSGKRTLAAALSGGEWRGPNVVIDICDMPDDVPLALPTADLYLYVTRTEEHLGERQRSHLRQLVHRSGRVICTLNRPLEWPQPTRELQLRASDTLGLSPERVFCTSALDRSMVQRELVPGLVREMSHLALPLGRYLTTVRDAAAEFLILDASRVNAEFAIVSSLPGFVPVVGSFASAGTDLLVLTKNQVMLLLKLALLYHRPIDNRWQVLAEVAPVIGAAFFWRSAARALVTMLPGPLALAPRGAVAFVGTYVAGRAGQYYYRSGLRPSPDVLGSFREEAVRQLGGVWPALGELGRHLRFL